MIVVILLGTTPNGIAVGFLRLSLEIILLGFGISEYAARGAKESPRVAWGELVC